MRVVAQAGWDPAVERAMVVRSRGLLNLMAVKGFRGIVLKDMFYQMVVLIGIVGHRVLKTLGHMLPLGRTGGNLVQEGTKTGSGFSVEILGMSGIGMEVMVMGFAVVSATRFGRCCPFWRPRPLGSCAS